MTSKESVLPPFPNGWFVVEISKKLKKGQILTKKFMGHDVVVFRTESGEACVMDAYCPHMGAHFGFGGNVQGECVRCPFHSFEFDTKGNCTKTGYGTTPPSRAKATVFPVNEVNGVILAYYDADGKAPDWTIPKINTEGWMPFEWVEWELRSHPQETSENSVDIGHFSEIHGYNKVAILEEPFTEGPYLSAKYGMERHSFLGKNFKPIQIEFTPHVHGLGFSFVEAKTSPYGLETRHFVLPTPTDGDKIVLRIASSLKKITQPGRINPLLSIFPKSLLSYIISKQVIREYKKDVYQDFKIWENKKYIIRTPLAPGDGPIGFYRLWARQFYNEPTADVLT